MASMVINISLPEELLQDVDQLARLEKRSRSELFREAVRRYLQQAALGWSRADRRAFAELSSSSLDRIWDNAVDAGLWDDWEARRASCQDSQTAVRSCSFPSRSPT
jgi:Arc/MetJ-type ribon-helix-helix transcriptional regulator